MKKTAIYSFLILCCGILLACSNQKVLDEKNQSTTPNKDEAVKARHIYMQKILNYGSLFLYLQSAIMRLQGRKYVMMKK